MHLCIQVFVCVCARARACGVCVCVCVHVEARAKSGFFLHSLPPCSLRFEIRSLTKPAAF